MDEYMLKGNMGRIYAEIRKQMEIRKKVLNIIRSNTLPEVALRWKEYTEKFYERIIDADVLESEDQVEIDELGPLILREEFDRALKE